MRHIPSTYNVIKYKARIPVSLDLFKTVTSAATFARESSGFFFAIIHAFRSVLQRAPNLTTTSIKTITTSRTFPAKLVFSRALFLEKPFRTVSNAVVYAYLQFYLFLHISTTYLYTKKTRNVWWKCHDFYFSLLQHCKFPRYFYVCSVFLAFYCFYSSYYFLDNVL